MYKITNNSTTNLALPGGANLAPNESKEVASITSTLGQLQSSGAISIVPVSTPTPAAPKPAVTKVVVPPKETKMESKPDVEPEPDPESEVSLKPTRKKKGD
jgi:hypothetical protein